MSHYLGWRCCFLVTTEWALCNLYFVATKLKETLPANKGGERTWMDYATEAKRVLGDRHVIVLGLVQSISMMILLTVNLDFAQVLGEVFHQDRIQIAWKLAVVVAVMVVPAIVAETVSVRIGATNVLRGAAALFLVPIVGAFVVGKGAWQSWQAMFAVVLVSMLPVVPCGLSANTLYFQTLKEESGAASGMNKCLEMMITCFSSFGSSYLVQSATNRASALLFWIAVSVTTLFVVFWLGFGLHPPRWASRSSAEEAPEDREVLAKKDMTISPRNTPRDLRVRRD